QARDVGGLSFPAAEHDRFPDLHGAGGRCVRWYLPDIVGPPVRPGVRGTGQLRPLVHQRSTVPDRALEYFLFHDRQRPGVDNHRARACAGSYLGPARHPAVPDGVLPAGDHRHGGRRADLALVLQPGFRDPELPAVGDGRRATTELAVEPDMGDAGGDHPLDLEAGRVQHGDLPRGVAGDPGAALRGGIDRWRRAVAEVQGNHAPVADADNVLCARHFVYRLAAGVRCGARAYRWRPRQLDADDGLPHLGGGVRLPADGLRGRGGVGVVLHRLPDHTDPVE